MSVELDEASVFLAAEEELFHWSLKLNDDRVVARKNLWLEDVSNWKWSKVVLELVENS